MALVVLKWTHVDRVVLYCPSLAHASLAVTLNGEIDHTYQQPEPSVATELAMASRFEMEHGHRQSAEPCRYPNKMTEPNPYDPVIADAPSDDPSDPMGAVRSAGVGALWSIVLSFPITVALAALFRFPVPLGTMDGGIDHILPSLFGLLFYGILMGGFVVLGGAGGFAALVVHSRVKSLQTRRVYIRLLAGLSSAVLLFLLSILDWVIGPW